MDSHRAPALTPEQLKDVEDNKDVAAMSYLWIMAVVTRYGRRDSPFVQYHARQGLWLFALSIPVWLIPRVGNYLEFFVVAGMIIGFINAAQGRYHDVPVVGALAKGTLTLSDLSRTLMDFLRRCGRAVKKGVQP